MRRFLAVLAVTLACLGIPGRGDAPWSASVEIDEGVRVSLRAGREIVLEVLPEKGEGWRSLARRVCGDESRFPALAAANRGLVPIEGRPVEVPWELLREEYRYLALRALFPADRWSSRRKAWEHVPARARVLTYGEGLWQVALWFTGRGENWERIAEFNGIPGPDLPGDRPVFVPGDLLVPLFRVPETGANGVLRYGRDAKGDYAEYVLRRGEALWSAVVLRFTDYVDKDDVEEAAREIAARNGIRDVRKIPAGARIRIPLDMLALPYLPENHPRRVLARLMGTGAEEAAAKPPAPPGKEKRPAPPEPRRLAGVHVILDPGHGGEDIGARARRPEVWESDYVYDVACRARRLLERDGATVHMLVRDTEYGCRVFDRERLPMNRREVILTHPPHRNRGGRSTRIGVNLRWYLANDIFARLTRKGAKDRVPPERVVFLSLHADSLHRKLRGGMVYVPGARWRKARHAVRGAAYRRYREYRARPRVTVRRTDRRRDEILSRKLARSLLAAYREEKLPVHANRPIRDHVVRGTRRRKRSWVPAVLRGNLVPAKVLLETVNLGNPSDARLLADPKGRERIARAIARGIRTYFDDPPRRSGRATSSRRTKR